MKGKFRILKTRDKVYVLVPETQAMYLESLLCTTYKGLDNSITRKIKDMTSNKNVADIEMDKWSSRMGQVIYHDDHDDSELIQTAADVINEVPERKKKADEFVKDVMGEVFGKVTYDKSGTVQTSARNKNARKRKQFVPQAAPVEQPPAPPVPPPEPEIRRLPPRSRTPSPPPVEQPPVPPQPPSQELVVRKDLNVEYVPVGNNEIDAALSTAKSKYEFEGASKVAADIVGSLEGSETIKDQITKSKYRIFIDTGIQWGAIILFLGMLGVVETWYEAMRQSDVRTLQSPSELTEIWSENYFPDYGNYWTEARKFYDWNNETMKERAELERDMNERYLMMDTERVAKEIWYSDSERFMDSISKSVSPTIPLSEFAKNMWSQTEYSDFDKEFLKLNKEQKITVGVSSMSVESVLHRLEHFEHVTHDVVNENHRPSPLEIYQNTMIMKLNNKYKNFSNYIRDQGKYSRGYRLDTETEKFGNKPVLLNWAKLTRVYENSAWNLFTDFYNVLSIAVDYTGMGVSRYASYTNNHFIKLLTGIYDEHVYRTTREFRREMYKALGIFIVFLTPTISEFVGAGKNMYKLLFRSHRTELYKNVGYNLKMGITKVSDLFLMSGMVATAYSTLALLRAAHDEGIVNNYQTVLGEARLSSYYMANLMQLSVSYAIRRFTSTDPTAEASVTEAARMGTTFIFLMSLANEDEPSELIGRMAREGQLIIPFVTIAAGAFNGLFVAGSFVRRQLN